jgi:hypothetical protein
MNSDPSLRFSLKPFFQALMVNAELDSHKTQDQTGQLGNDLQPQVSALSSPVDLHANLINGSEASTREISEKSSELPGAKEVKIDAARLEDAFTVTKHGAGGMNLAQAAQATAYEEELAKMCEALDGGRLVGESTTHDNHAPPGQGSDVDVKYELECTWLLNHRALLETQSKILDEVRALVPYPPVPVFNLEFKSLTGVRLFRRSQYSILSSFRPSRHYIRVCLKLISSSRN